MTKEELLSKGVSEDVADEIILAMDTQEDEQDSLSALQKALDDVPEEMELLEKAEDEDEDDEDKEDYDEKYMKKYMKRYMKANKGSCQKMMKELGDAGEKMSKAIDDFDEDADGAVIEMAELAPILEEQSELNAKMLKAIVVLSDQIESITEVSAKNYDLMTKAAKVQVEQAKGLQDFMSVPSGRKGVVAGAPLEKAIQPDATKFAPEDNQIIYQSLMKAVKEGDRNAGLVISAFDSKGKDANRLNTVQKKYIHELLSKEAN